MTDKTREEFEAWCLNEELWAHVQEGWKAWQHQQATIDALRVENARHVAAREALAFDVAKLRQQLKDAERDAREDRQSAATEAMWSERQGEDYGSY